MKIKLNYEQLGEWLLWRCEPKMKRIRSVYWVNKNSVGKTLINNIAEFHVISSFSFSSLVEILVTNWKHSIRRKHPLVILRIISSGKWYYFTVFFSCKLPKYIILFYMTEKKEKFMFDWVLVDGGQHFHWNHGKWNRNQFNYYRKCI